MLIIWALALNEVIIETINAPKVSQVIIINGIEIIPAKMRYFNPSSKVSLIFSIGSGISFFIKTLLIDFIIKPITKISPIKGIKKAIPAISTNLSVALQSFEMYSHTDAKLTIKNKIHRLFLNLLMGCYSKGASYERELLALLKDKGFAVVRVAGSGRARMEQPDLLASNGRKILGFECKYSGTDYKTIVKDEVNSLVDFCKKFNCVPVLAFRFQHTEWKFKIISDYVSENVSVKKNDDLLVMDEII